MLILSASQARNYYKKLKPSYHGEGCGCCSSEITYVIKGNRILRLSFDEHSGYRKRTVSVLAKIRKARSN